MHSNIFQIGLNPMNVDDYIHPEEFYENSYDFADYIGDEYEGEDRTVKIQWLAEEFPDILDIDGEVLIYKGLGNFLKEWVEKIQEVANGLTEGNILNDMNLYRMKRITERTHHNLNSRFFIEKWNGYAGDCSDFISWLATLGVGTRIYVGAVIDYHF